MKLEFEKWLEKQKFSEDTMDVFREAVICYKASAYRSALLMSYVGFMSIIRDKLINTKHIPDGFKKEEWINSVIKGICNHEHWENNTFEILKDKQKAFNISDNLRNQIYYWRNRRNDCAHNKNNKISYSHVESFWLFLMSNIDKISIKGSTEALLNEIDEYFDISRTPAYEPPDELAHKIVSIIDKDDVASFVLEMINKMEQRNGSLVGNQKHFEFMDAIFQKCIESNNEQLLKKFIKCFINEDTLKPVFIHFLMSYPKYVGWLDKEGNKTFIRKIWCDPIRKQNGDVIPNLLHIFDALLRHDLIPDNQKDEFLEQIFLNFGSYEYTIFANGINDSHAPLILEFSHILDNVFSMNGKYKKIEDMIIDDYDWTNKRSKIICSYLEQTEITKEHVKVLNDIFNKPYYPFNLHDGINEMLKKNSDKIEKIKKLVEENDDLNIPRIECLIDSFLDDLLDDLQNPDIEKNRIIKLFNIIDKNNSVKNRLYDKIKKLENDEKLKTNIQRIIQENNDIVIPEIFLSLIQ